jgi:hypothetical protein
LKRGGAFVPGRVLGNAIYRHGHVMRRTLTLRTTLSVLVATPALLTAVLLAALPATAEEAPVFSIVTGLAPDDLLNIRATASAIGKVEARLPSGTSVKNLGCGDVNGYPWCKVEQIDNPQVSGWAPARYLNPLNPRPVPGGVDGAATAHLPTPDLTARLGGTDPETAPASPDTISSTAMKDAYGLAMAMNGNALTGGVDGPAPDAGSTIPCARHVGQPMTLCQASVLHSGDQATVTVAWPDGGTRVISFQAGLPVASDSPDEFRFTREGSLNMIRVGASERFEITDAEVSGG